MDEYGKSVSREEVIFKNSRLPFGHRQLGDTDVHLWLLPIEQLPIPGVDGASPAASTRFVQRFYLRLLLAAYLDRPAHTVKLAKTPSGKPYIAEWGGGAKPPLFFSLSHHDGYLLVGLCKQHPVGVDLESETRRIRNPMKLAKRYFHPAEHEHLQTVPAEQFHDEWLSIWTCKEAVVKATGGGIVSGLDRFVVMPGEPQPQLAAAINTPIDDPLHKLKLIRLKPESGMFGAVACAQSIDRLRAWHLKGFSND